MVAQLLQTLSETHEQWLKRVAELCSAYGINASERHLLQHLLSSDQQTISQIAQHRQVSRQHIQVLIHPLVKKSLLILQQKPSDKRSVWVALTPAGEKIIQALIAEEQRYLEQLAERFLQEDVELSHRTAYALGMLLKSLPVKSSEANI